MKWFITFVFLVLSMPSNGAYVCVKDGSNPPCVNGVVVNSEEEVHRICQLLRQHHMDGVAATNTTVSREDIAGHPLAHETGGLSGPPVRALSNRVIRLLNENLQGEIPIIGIGGIDSAEAAAEKFDAGATLIQLYTGFIYQGPSLVRQIVDSLDSARIS